MKLTVKDLMIGDWARCHYINKLTGGEVIKDFQVTAIMLESFSHHESIWSKKGNMGKELEPIPLTPEILKKNGFELWKLWWTLTDDDDVYLIKYPDDDDCKLVLGRKTFPCNSVHTLQHALRLCGLNELADNFKI